MKLIIVEGTDRTGKDTLVNRLMQDHRHVIKRHWGFPRGDTNDEKTAYQKKAFRKEFEFYDLMYLNTTSDMIMIWNRAHIGEFVYGTIYRDSQPETWVWDLEKDFFMDEIDEVYLILLYADPEFVTQKDDGKSYSAKIEDKKREITAFLDAFENSGIQNKLKIKVNEGNAYIDQALIYTKVKQFIND